jgi:hypothetical protein
MAVSPLIATVVPKKSSKALSLAVNLTRWMNGSTSIRCARLVVRGAMRGGQFYTPSRVMRVLVEMFAPYKGRVYDPCCGSGGMFVSSEKFIEAHSGKIGDIDPYASREPNVGCY